MYRTILVPTDGSEAALAAAREASALAEAVGADRLLLVYVIDEGALSVLFSDQRLSDLLDVLSSEGTAATETTAEALADADVPVETDVVRGMRVSAALLEYARAHDVDLVVMGTQGRHGIEHLLGSTTERVLAGSEVPVLVLPRRRRD